MDKDFDQKLIVQELRKIGLTKKESQTYMILLMSGPLGAQKIATTLGMTRPTAYRLLEDLLEKSLIEKHALPGKKIKKYYAKSPDELIGLLRIKKREVEEQERELLRIISGLRKMYYHDDATTQSFLYTQEGLHMIFEDITATQASEILIYHNPDSPVCTEDIQGLQKLVADKRHKLPIKISSPSTKKSDLPYSGTIILTKKAYIISQEEISIINNRQVIEIIRTCLSK